MNSPFSAVRLPSALFVSPSVNAVDIQLRSHGCSLSLSSCPPPYRLQLHDAPIYVAAAAVAAVEADTAPLTAETTDAIGGLAAPLLSGAEVREAAVQSADIPKLNSAAAASQEDPTAHVAVPPHAHVPPHPPGLRTAMDPESGLPLVALPSLRG